MEFVAGKAIVWQQGATLYYQLTSKFILILIDRIFRPKLLAKEPKIGQKQQGSHGINAYMIIGLFEHISKCDVIRMDLGNEQEHSYIHKWNSYVWNSQKGNGTGNKRTEQHMLVMMMPFGKFRTYIYI